METVPSQANISMRVGVVFKPVRFLNFDLERPRLLRSSTMSQGQSASLLLVGGETSSATTVATAITTTARKAASAMKASATSEPTATTPTAHARDIGTLGGHLDVTSLEDTLVENKSLGDQARLGELDVGVTTERYVSNAQKAPAYQHTPSVDL